MKSIINKGFHRFKILKCHDCDPDEPTLEFRNTTSAFSFLSIFISDPFNMMILRDAFARSSLCADLYSLYRLTDHDVCQRLAYQIASGYIKLVPVGVPYALPISGPEEIEATGTTIIPPIHTEVSRKLSEPEEAEADEIPKFEVITTNVAPPIPTEISEQLSEPELEPKMDELPAEESPHGGLEVQKPEPMLVPPPSDEPELQVEPRLVLNNVDHHFAPSVEIVNFDYSIQGLRDEKIDLEISSDHYPNNPIYTRELTANDKADGDHKIISWNGRANGGGPLQNKYINPLYAPYKVKMKCAKIANGKTDEKLFLVLYHSIKIQDGTYTADDNEPDANAELIKWVQYKLNKLGYFAGPVDDTDRPQLRRAIRRYTYAMPGLFGINKTIDDRNNAKFQQQLRDGKGTRQILQNNHFPAVGTQAKAYIDHDYFYAGEHDFLNAQGHTAKDTAMLDRFEWPLEVKVYLLSKNDGDGTKNGIDASQAVGPVDIEWSVEDTPEDTTHLPAPGNLHIPSRTRNYVQAALQATRAVAGNNDNDNCPDTNGNGQRHNPARNADYFGIGNYPEPFTSQNVGGVVYTKVHVNANANPNKIGRAGVLFRGSYIAGDTYKVKAKISFTRHNADNGQLVQSHTDLANKTNKTLDKMLGAETGEIVIWRRHHISALVNWPDPGRDIDFNGIAQMYEYANCELDITHEDYDIEDLYDTAIKRDALLDVLHNHLPMWERDNMVFNNKGLYPFPIRPQRLNESAADYKIYINGEVYEGLPNINMTFDIIAESLYDQVSGLRPAGTIVLRANLVAPVRIRRKLPLLLRFGLIRSIEDWFDWHPNYYSGDQLHAVSAGNNKGVALLDNAGTVMDKDKYLFAHEMAHCRYMQHWEAPGGQDQDHDQNDHNCIMSYAERIPTRPNLHWSKGNLDEPRFCGKCILKLRGWDVRAGGMPAQS
jgi:hypothetical protein